MTHEVTRSPIAPKAPRSRARQYYGAAFLEAYLVRVGGCIVALATDPPWGWRGVVEVESTGTVWEFAELREPNAGTFDPAALALAAVGFGGYYTGGNRDDVPEWAPSPEVADEIDAATMWDDDAVVLGP